MPRRTLGIATVIGLIAAPGLVGTAGADEGGRPLSATLTGVNEVPGPGDSDGFGSASLTLNPGHKKICLTIHVGAITLPATAAHIHQGAAGVAGPIVVTLLPPTVGGSSTGCVSVPDRST